MIRVLVADDEAPARAKLLKLLAGEPDITVVGQAGDGDETVERIRELAPDLIFLDIHMPKRDGFGVIEAIGVGRMPAVVFVTAYDEHALRAFEVEAIDYLLKPFSPTRFRRVLDRARDAARREEATDALHKLLERAGGDRRFATRLLVRAGDGRELFLAVDRISVIRADKNYLRLATPEGEFVRRGTVRELVGRLDPDRFLQINRSEIVRLDAVRELQPWFHGDYHVVMVDGTALVWSRRYRKRAPDVF